VTSLERVERPAAWADRPASSPWRTALRASVGLVTDSATLAWAELLKIRHDPLELLTRAIQPILWLLVFGEVLARTRAIPTGGLDYMDFLTPGVLAQSALFMAIFYGINVIFERDLGIVHKLLVSPASRVALVLGKAIGGGVRALSQAVIVYVVAWLIGVHLRLELLPMAGVALTVVVGAAVFSTFSLAIACIVRSRERFMGIGQVLTMPLFFASSAIYPVALMPDWLKVVAAVNPLSYMVDAARTMMIVGGVSEHGLGVDAAVLLFALVLLLWITARLYPRLAQ
jgi:ABC-2 type transport system permease protein